MKCVRDVTRFDLVCILCVCVCVCVFTLRRTGVCAQAPPRTRPVPGFVARIWPFSPLPSSRAVSHCFFSTPTSPSHTHNPKYPHARALTTAGVIRNPTRDQFSHIPWCSSRLCLLSLTLLTAPRALGDSGLSGHRSGGVRGQQMEGT